MVDRQDIDALLISALYGELTLADEARLQTHLDSHPGDRTALADLTLARNAVRESRILQVQLDPPQSVSALLLQEAARRAPKMVPVKSDQEREGWFQRFVRSFVAHPAFAAAAMLVLVVGIAGTMYLRDGDLQVAEQTADRHEMSPSASSEPAFKEVASNDLEFASKQLQATAGSAFQATLEDGKDGNRKLDEGKAGQAAPEDLKTENEASNRQDNKDKVSPDPAPTTPPPAPKQSPTRRTGDTYLSVQRTNPKPKELDDTRGVTRDQLGAKNDRAESDDETLRLNRRPSGGVGGSTTVTRSDPAAPGADRNVNTPRSTTTSPPPPPVTIVTGRDGPTEERQETEEATVLGWAKEVHGKVVAAVRANNCKEATSLAVTLSSKAPGYYAQNVENDRALKQCVTYINAEREKETERAQRARAAQQRRTTDETTKKSASPSSK